MSGSQPGLATVSLRLRLTLAVIAVLGVVLILLSVVVSTIFAAQTAKNLDTLLTGRVQLARQLARAGAGPQVIINRVQADGVQASLVLVNGAQFGAPVPVGQRIVTRRVALVGPGRIDGSELTLAVDTSIVDGSRTTLRRTLWLASAVALGVSALLVILVVRLALRPLTSMATVARSIAEGQRGRRLRPTRTDTELGATAAAFDEMLDELEGAESRAQQAEEHSRTFLADAAHELRTPITGVQAAAEILLQQGSDLDQAQTERLQVLLIMEARRAGKLVSDLLATSRLDTGIDLELTSFSLATLVSAELERARLLHPDATIEQHGGDVTVTADSGKITEIVDNLLDNALRACGPQGRVATVLSHTPGQACLEVLDSGPGVRRADRERIFERLVRLDRARASDSGGSGLGLAIARGYARAHHGDLTCEEPPQGWGARFRLVLPTSAAP